jgi:hypothetical protein
MKAANRVESIFNDPRRVAEEGRTFRSIRCPGVGLIPVVFLAIAHRRAYRHIATAMAYVILGILRTQWVSLLRRRGRKVEYRYLGTRTNPEHGGSDTNSSDLRNQTVLNWQRRTSSSGPRGGQISEQAERST